ncbi:cation:proton antiporter [Propionivibrio dicarboxylicus]|uniref:Kef-type potassium/proton antiporter, CPA2 family n=1 Tax=Propionivibrio dicarboxylicus TaxID=83767 RepID=A0A1G8EA79_9RHOO|nr:cation:proton antiporter [Propionivibrio dicarboxylicus]SDH66599.1 Kef-type potassium/proton antiporter, CPA2 family [Propionivibrio dicarboxylicus]
MHESTPLITTIALALGFGLILGYLAERIKLPALVGYLLAGVVIGPHTPGVFADVKLAHELAEIGVMLLMFGVGLHFSLDDLRQVRKIALPGALLQMAAAATLGTALGIAWGWAFGGALVFGLSLSVASTVVLLRSLEARGVLDSMNGRIAVGWLIVQDLVMVFVLVLLPPLAGQLGGTAVSHDAGSPLWLELAKTLGKVALFIVLMLVAGRRFVPKLLWRVARTGSRELFTLSVIAAAVSIAYVASGLFSVSFALGAFFAGMVLGESDFSHRAAEESLPLREAFSVLFFVSVGMLFDPAILVEHPLQVLAVLALIVVINPLAAALIVIVFRYPLNTALLMQAGLAQIGEFSFILAGLGISLGLLPIEGQNLILAGALLSITANQMIFSLTGPALKWIRARSALARKLERSDDPLAELPMSTDEKFLSGQVVLVGYGRVGRRIAATLTDKGIPFVVAEQNRETVEALRARGFAAVSGNAADPAVLIQAHIARAGLVVIAVSDTFEVRRMLDTARTLNPGIEVVVRCANDEEATLLAQETAGRFFLGEAELAHNISAHILNRYGKSV